jgi:hypothetical protein
MDREEYIKKIRKLLKKYHPDLCGNESLENIYSEITIKLNLTLEQINNKSANINAKNLSDNNRLDINNSAYEYYKSGIAYYKSIHHDQFYHKSKGGTNTPKTFDEQLKILNKIFMSFNIAEYYFSKVINEFPKSEWADDSIDKIKYLKKLYKSYENMDIENNNKIIDNNKFVNQMGLNIL